MDVGHGLYPSVDAGAAADARLAMDALLPPDLAPAVGCAALQPLANGVLTPRHAVRALFAPDRTSLILRVRGEAPSESSVYDDLLLVQLPSGKVSTIINSITSAEWLRPGSTLLVRAEQEGRIDLVVVRPDGSGLRTLAQGVCDHVAAPDGTRVYAMRDCYSYRMGAMDVIDVVSGAIARLAVGAQAGTAAVSPDGRWVAFLTSIPVDGGSSQNLVVVGGADGRVETLASQPDAAQLGFVSDRLLLFRNGSSYINGDIRGHVPGTGDTSHLVAANRHPGWYGYRVSPDGTWLLGATEVTTFVAALYAIRLDGTGERLLASDLYDFWRNQLGPQVFAFTASGRVIYKKDGDPAVATIGLDGSAPMEIAGPEWFLEAPRLNQVALVGPPETMAMTDRLQLADSESGTAVFTYDSDGNVNTVGFPPDGRGLVFVESPTPGSHRLRYGSADKSVVLGEWQSSVFGWDSLSDAPPLHTYPIDPTGCFTVFDTDLAPSPGTRLAILPQ